jgi:hypothetical protein
MKKILFPALAAMMLAVSCGPSKHAVHVEMRYPSKSGIELAGKNVSVVYLTSGDQDADGFYEAMAGGFAKALEQDYGTGEGSVGLYTLADKGGKYHHKDTLVNLLMDTGADAVFLFDRLKLTPMSNGGSKIDLKLYCFDAMNPKENVYVFGGSTILQSDDKAEDTGKTVASSFLSQWKHEQYSIVYYDGEKWYKALDMAEAYDWKGAMDVWMSLLNTGDLLKRSCAEYNVAVACYMLGDYLLASEWLDRSDADNLLPLSEALRKRINSRL